MDGGYMSPPPHGAGKSEVRRLERLYGVWYGLYELLFGFGCASKS